VTMSYCSCGQCWTTKQRTRLQYSNQIHIYT
jgi:hypothetical protein